MIVRCTARCVQCDPGLRPGSDVFSPARGNALDGELAVEELGWLEKLLLDR